MTSAMQKDAWTWIHGYTATAVGLVAASAPIPGAGTVVCISIETSMCFHIGKIYGYDMTWEIARDHSIKIGLATIVGGLAALEAATLAGPFAFVLKPTIAAPLIEVLGKTVIDYYENGCNG
jgi:uncharacterized protein (DUF697 family)